MVSNRCAAALAGLTTLVISCGPTGAERAFDEFLGRADRAPPALDEPALDGIFTDITGAYLANIFIRPLGEVYLELRISFTEFELLAGHEGAVVRGNFTFPDEPADAAPLAEFESRYRPDGTLEIRSGYVRIEPERSPIEDTAVEVEFILHVVVLSEDSLCGAITDPESETVLPLPLVLRGTTFGAARYVDPNHVPVDVPSSCPADVAPPLDNGFDVGIGDVADVGGDAGLVPPDVDLVAGSRADVSGRFWFAATIPGLPTQLGLIADISYHEDGESASIDGTLRSRTDPAGPAAAVFSEAVDPDGGFTAVIPNLSVSVGALEVDASLALRGIIVSEDLFCGAGAGAVTSPLSLDLDGSTFGAVRIADEAIDEPNEVVTGCP